MNFKEYKEKAFKENPELYEEYKELEPEYELIKQVIKIRKDQELTQKELADRTGTKQRAFHSRCDKTGTESSW